MREEQGLLNMVKTAFFPVVIYYFVRQTAAIFLLGMLDRTGLNEDGSIFALCARMLAMIIAGLTVYPFYKNEVLYKNRCKSTRGNKEHIIQKNIAKNMSLRDVVSVVLAGAVFSLMLNYLFAITGLTSSSEAYNQVAQSQFSYGLFPALVFYGVVSPVVEELVFRGIVYSSLKRTVSVVPAIAGSALLFGAIHGNVVQMLYGTLMGMVMAYLYEKQDTLLAPVLFHGAANVAVYLVTYVRI